MLKCLFIHFSFFFFLFFSLFSFPRLIRICMTPCGNGGLTTVWMRIILFVHATVDDEVMLEILQSHRQQTMMFFYLLHIHFVFFLLCFVCLCILCSIQYSNLSELAAEKPKWGPIHYIANNNNHKKKTERMMIYKHTWYSTNILGQALTALAVVRHTTDVCFGSNGAARNVDTFTYHACMACRGYITIYERSI